MHFSEGPDAYLVVGSDDVAVLFEEKKGGHATSWKVVFDQDKTIRVERQTTHGGHRGIAETQDPEEVVVEVNDYYGYRGKGDNLPPELRERLRLFARACEFVSDHLSDLPKGLEINVPKHH